MAIRPVVNFYQISDTASERFPASACRDLDQRKAVGHITDPHKAVAVVVAPLKANPLLPGGFLVTGLVYDVTTGRIEIVVPPSLLRPENPVPVTL